MSRNNRRRRSQSRLARPPSALDHTASRFGGPVLDFDLPDYPSVSLDDLREAFSVSNPSQVRTLIRTVLPEPERSRSIKPRKRTQSPTLPVRATFRSSDRVVKSPFLIATGNTPQLPERAIHCAKRGIRREVLFATKSTGQGAKSPRRKRSKVRC